MPLPIMNFPIVDSPIGGAIDRYQDMINQAIIQRMGAAQAQAEETKLPYIAPKEAADLMRMNLANKLTGIDIKYKPQDYESTFASRSASTRGANLDSQVKELKLKYPGLGEGGIAGEIALAKMYSDRPDLAKSLTAYMQQNAPQQSQPSAVNGSGGVAQQVGQQPSSYDPTAMLLNDVVSQRTSRDSLANYRNAGGASMRYAPAQQKNVMAFQNQLQAEHPDWTPEFADKATSAYLQQADMVDGVQLPPLSGKARSYRTEVYNKSSSTGIQNTAAALANTSDELHNIDIEPIKAFAGLSGKADYLAQKSGVKARTQDWRDYDAFRTVDAKLVMDSLRQSLKTSVQPGWVQDTLGQFSNPNDEMWDDPEQVEAKWNKLLNWIDRAAKNTSKQAKYGATTELNDSGSDKESSSVNRVSSWSPGKGVTRISE